MSEDVIYIKKNETQCNECWLDEMCFANKEMGIVFFRSGRNGSFYGNGIAEKTYKELDMVGGNTELEDLENYFDVDAAKAQKISSIIKQSEIYLPADHYWNKDDVFTEILEIVTGKKYNAYMLRGACQRDWIMCAIPGDYDQKEMIDYCSSLFFDTGLSVTLSYNKYFDDPFDDYIYIPFPLDDEIINWANKMYGYCKIVTDAEIVAAREEMAAAQNGKTKAEKTMEEQSKIVHIKIADTDPGWSDPIEEYYILDNGAETERKLIELQDKISKRNEDAMIDHVSEFITKNFTTINCKEYTLYW